jgi:hypothetical protein
MNERTQMKIHPVAAMFPMIQEGTIQWNDLLESVKSHGQIDPIVYDGDVLIDGRNRLAVCQKIGIKPKSIQWADLKLSMPVHEWIFTRNFDRRHMTQDQKVATHAEYQAWQLAQEGVENKKAVQFKPGKSGNPSGKAKEQVNTDSYSPAIDAKKQNANSTVGQIAKAAGVSHHKAAQAVKIVKAAKDSPEAARVLDRVKAGIIPLKDAFKAVAPTPKPKEDKPAWASLWKSFKRLTKQEQTAFIAHVENHWTAEQGVIEQ